MDAARKAQLTKILADCEAGLARFSPTNPMRPVLERNADYARKELVK